MDLFKKSLLILALITSFGHIAAAPAPQNEHPEAHDDSEDESEDTTPKAPLGLRFRRLITAWLCIPEDQLTMKNHLQNSIPGLICTAHTQSFSKYWAALPQHEMDWRLALATILPSIGYSDFLVFPTNISLQRPQKEGLESSLSTSGILKKIVLNVLRGIPTFNRANMLNQIISGTRSMALNIAQPAGGHTHGEMMRSYANAITNNHEHTALLHKSILHALINIFEGEEIVRKCIKRKKLLTRLAKAVPLVWSRRIPASMTNKKYIVFEGTIGYLLRNASHLVRGMRSLTPFLHVGSEWLAKKENEFFKDRGSSKWEKKVHTIATRSLKHASNSTDCLNNIMNAVTTRLGITGVIGNAHPIARTLFQLPYAPHCYIEESEFKKLSKHDQIALYQLASEDWFDAVETINNTPLALCKSL